MTALQPVESTLMKIALDVELFAKLDEGDDKTKTLSSLAEATNVEPALLSKNSTMLYFYVSVLNT